MNLLAIKGLLGVGIALALAAVVTYYTHIQRDIGREEVRRDWAEANEKANAVEREKEQQHIETLNKVQHEISLERAKSERLSRDNASIVQRMREHTDSTPDLLKSADAQACRVYAGTISNVLASCTDAVVTMARSADECSSVAWALDNAWPE